MSAHVYIMLYEYIYIQRGGLTVVRRWMLKLHYSNGKLPFWDRWCNNAIRSTEFPVVKQDAAGPWNETRQREVTVLSRCERSAIFTLEFHEVLLMFTFAHLSPTYGVLGRFIFVGEVFIYRPASLFRGNVWKFSHKNKKRAVWKMARNVFVPFSALTVDKQAIKIWNNLGIVTMEPFSLCGEKGLLYY